ncbi:ArsR family transcriptional regulator [Haloplanus rallus]|jgi:predicted transcriptional regulator|uniref:ArsR family transcriptional regulator n=1 Tax=Haloplanus rallus TaxID=1816183 RepID=A0A6B9F7Y5_9EURY|nr:MULTISPECIES: helix-turn-helix domain-containing protein [Haloplanus]QGX94477.1 ArsR family transcriptional regulator [Haloplanus rallus]
MDGTEMLRVLGNEYNPQILSFAHEPRSAQELSDELDVPIATCYRRIEELTDANLLEHHDRVLSDERRRVNVYRRNIEEVVVNFSEGEVSVDVEERRQVTNRLDEAWRTLSE